MSTVKQLKTKEMNATKYNDWTLIKWDGNRDLNYKCYRKSFGRGHVSIGVGEFKSIVYSYGNNSEDSMSSTRFRQSGILTPEQAMKIVDENNGKYNYKNN